ncbi:MAG: DegT/DnrJ/EryC1/StrS family aminotransferase [Nitrospirae bacterium]|nr:DegT/DnrJ/EryC1/StrS family aminotransferase [Nitrospirota bacterium]
MQDQIRKPIYVTQPSLPPLDEYTRILEGVWERGILTHNGPMVQLLEKELIDYLHVPNLVAVTNGTIAIQLAIRALNLEGEIITTPFTWIATASAIMWEKCRPVFADVQPDTFNIDPQRIEEKITDRTSAIIPVHVFSNPCDVEAIQKIADKHNLKVIYDAAHAMCVDYNGKSLLEYGDITATSFHATKIFQSGEGGACITKDRELFERLRRLRFFGHDEKKDIVDEGLNGKMTEVHAALGLASLKWLDKVLHDRREKYELYMSLLENCGFIEFQNFPPDSYNYSYMPVLLENEEQLLALTEHLNGHNIYPRRYFHPSLNTVDVVSSKEHFPVAEDLASRILCLPLFYTLKKTDIEYICGLIINCRRR